MNVERTANRPFPYDAAGAIATDTWRQKLVWPLRYAEARDLGRNSTTALLHAIACQDEDVAHIFSAATATALRTLPAFLEAALLFERCAADRFASRMPEVGQILAGRQGEVTAAPPDDAAAMRVMRPNRPMARTLVWTASWTPWWKTPAALLTPKTAVFNKNPLLVECAKARSGRLRYANCESILADAIELRMQRLSEEQLRAAAESVFETVLNSMPVSQAIRDRLLLILVNRTLPTLVAVDQAVAGLSSMSNLPADVWAGTGGYWPSRLVGMEVIRRGGTVKRFDHGGNRLLRKDVQNVTAVEAVTATDVVMFTEQAAEDWNKRNLSGLLPKGRTVHFEKSWCPPRKVEKPKISPAAGDRPNVVYVTGAIRGFRQVIPAAMPDVVYLDFQLGVAEKLARLPINLMLRPHPDGLMGGDRHPLNAVQKTASENFEVLLEASDVVVIDSPFSRVFGSAISSTKRVVFLDPGYDYFSEETRPLVENRCVTIPISQDDQGRFQVDNDALAHAVLEASTPDSELVFMLRRHFGGYL